MCSLQWGEGRGQLPLRACSDFDVIDVRGDTVSRRDLAADTDREAHGFL